MKTKIFFLLMLFFVPLLYSQQVKESIITQIPILEYKSEAYNFKFDPHSRNWLYFAYDTVIAKNVIISSWGTIATDAFVFVGNAFFDESGNIYYIVDKSKYESDRQEFSFMKNDQIVLTSYFIGDNWALRDGILYFQIIDDGYSYLTTYNLKTGELKRSKPYYNIEFIYYKGTIAEEREAYGFPGFTKSGKVYYIASEEGKSFLVVGEKEYKKYSDIDRWNLVFDALENPVYIAKSKGSLYMEKGNTFLVHGDKEYKSFDYVISPVIGNDNIPIYIGQDSIGEYRYRSHLMKGSKEIDVIDGDIANIKVSKDGKLSYVVTTERKIKADSSIFKSYLVYDDKKTQKYDYIFDYELHNGNLIMAVQIDNKSVLLSNGKAISDKYDNLSTFKFLDDNNLAYIATNYGDYSLELPDKNYVVIGNKTYGPYDGLTFANFDDSNSFVYANQDLYAFIKTRNTYDYQSTKFSVVSNKWVSEEFDYVDKLQIINGKVIYITSTGDFEEGNEKYSIYIDNKFIAGGYDSVGESWVNGNKFSMVVSKGNTMYYIEIEL